jgi:hypothetical protein
MLKIFTVSEPRVLKMNMRINDAGQNESIRGIDDFAAGKITGVIREKGDFTRSDTDSTWKSAPSCNNGAVYKCSVHFHVGSPSLLKFEPVESNSGSNFEGSDEQ